ncbi:hypothetical protein Pint_33981 [Pistacia integerrima]|uniref:Uncharacterized protein n=1 Tax=Pistacia integerrima TaxID=434235 RepID=A0ACC0X604_9ROSI|nr:hypothetical protein Pint_33981 [Pistacia integerrima]
MEGKIQRPFSLRLNRRNQTPRAKDTEGGRFSQDYPMKDRLEERIYSTSSCSRHHMDVTNPLCVANSRLVLPILGGFLFRSICNKQGKVFIILDTMGFVPKPQHRCPIPVADDPNRIVIPKERTPDEIVKNLTYIMEEVFVNNGSHSFPLFGGNQSWSQREESLKLNSTMKVHCGFMRNGGEAS